MGPNYLPKVESEVPGKDGNGNTRGKKEVMADDRLIDCHSVT